MSGGKWLDITDTKTSPFEVQINVRRCGVYRYRAVTPVSWCGGRALVDVGGPWTPGLPEDHPLAANGIVR